MQTRFDKVIINGTIDLLLAVSRRGKTRHADLTESTWAYIE